MLLQVGLADATVEGNPIINVRTNAKFAFIEFRSIEETNNALNMNGIPFNSMELRIKRPEKFPGPPTASVDWREFMELRAEVEANKPKVNGANVAACGAV